MMDTVGRRLGARTSTSDALDVAASPWLSVARAVIECVPAAAPASVTRHGGPYAVPTRFVPSKKSTRTITPDVLAASAPSTRSSGPSTCEHPAGRVTTTFGPS